ncbi:MAG: CoA transferase [Actinobacteria bacterium]|nr:CoA transferase [Actinomycetota bacterium]
MKMRSMLEGVRVIDFTNTVAGPGCTFFLADMGAEVIKVERPGLGDEARLFPPYKDGTSASFAVLNRGKRGVVLDLKKPRAVELFKELTAVSDVLVENYRPGVMKKLGLDYDVLKDINPRLVMCSISGYGQYGPLSHLPAYDAVLQAMSGLMSTTGFPETPPTRAGTLIVDISCAFYSAFGVCAALFARERTGEGEYLDVSMYDVAINLLEAKFVDYTVTGNIPQRTGNRYPYVTPFDAYATRDGYVMIICVGDQPFHNLCNAMGKPELADDERFKDIMARNAHEPELKEVIEEWASTLTCSEVWELMQEHGVPGAPVNDIKSVVENPHTAARGMLVDLEQPGAGTITIFGSAMKALGSEIRPRGPAPALGQDNRWLLEEVLKKSPGEAEDLLASGAMG